MSKNSHKVDRNDALVIGGASVGTVFEWYDFYLYGSLASYHHPALLLRRERDHRLSSSPCWPSRRASRCGRSGRSMFGRLGDLWGRKNTFLVTMLLMGLSTFAVGLLPSLRQHRRRGRPIAAGHLAPGPGPGAWAASTAGRPPMSPSMRRRAERGLYTSWIQTTATRGPVPQPDRHPAGHAPATSATDAFAAWGWRIPFLLSRSCCWACRCGSACGSTRARCSSEVMDEGKTSQEAADARPSANWRNLEAGDPGAGRLTAGQAVVWYTGQFYALFFLEKIAEGRRRADQPPWWPWPWCWRRRSSCCSAGCRTRSAASRSSWAAACWRR